MDLSTAIFAGLTGTAGVVAVVFGIATIIDFITAIINFKKPEMYCAKCRKKLTKTKGKCPKCKTVLE